MSQAFPRTLRSMEAETFRRPLWAVFLSIILLLAWASWFYQARLSVYEISSKAYIEEFEGTTKRLVANFLPMIGSDRIRPGQSAWLHIDQYPAIPATVVQIDPQVYEGYIRVIFTLHPGSELLLMPGSTGTVEVEVERVSPAALVLRVAKQWVEVNLKIDYNQPDSLH